MPDELLQWELEFTRALSSFRFVADGTRKPVRFFPDVADLDQLERDRAAGTHARDAHIVYSVTGEEYDSAQEGDTLLGVDLDIDIRSSSRARVGALRTQLISALSERGLIQTLSFATWIYDAETGIRRAVVSVTLNPYPTTFVIRGLTTGAFSTEFSDDFDRLAAAA